MTTTPPEHPEATVTNIGDHRPPDPQRLEWVERIAAMVEEAGASLAYVAEALDTEHVDDMLAMYGILQDLINVAKDAQAVVGAELVKHVPSRFDPYPVPGGGTFKIAGGRERKNYDQPRLVSAVAEAVATKAGIAGVITDDGEHVTGHDNIIWCIEQFAEVAGVTAPSYSNWRSTVAKAYGLKLNDYADIDHSPITTRIEGRGRTGAR